MQTHPPDKIQVQEERGGKMNLFTFDMNICYVLVHFQKKFQHKLL